MGWKKPFFFYDTQLLSEESVLLLICFSEKKYQLTTLKMQHISMVAQIAINNICTLLLGLNRDEIFHGYYIIYIIEIYIEMYCGLLYFSNLKWHFMNIRLIGAYHENSGKKQKYLKKKIKIPK